MADAYGPKEASEGAVQRKAKKIVITVEIKDTPEGDLIFAYGADNRLTGSALDADTCCTCTRSS